MKNAKIDNCDCLGADITAMSYGLSTWNEYYPCGFSVRYPMSMTPSVDIKSATMEDPNRKLARKMHIKYHRQYKL